MAARDAGEERKVTANVSYAACSHLWRYDELSQSRDLARVPSLSTVQSAAFWHPLDFEDLAPACAAVHHVKA